MRHILITYTIMLLAWELYKNIMFGQIEINTRIILKIFAILNTIFVTIRNKPYCFE